MEQLLDSNYQIQGYSGPQKCVTHTALSDATSAIARVLYEKWAVIGYLAVEFQVYRDTEEGSARLVDTEEGSSRLVALGFNLGLGPAFLGGEDLSCDMSI